MRRIFFLLMVTVQSAYAQNQPGSLTVEKIMQDPKWIGTSPLEPRWSPDNQSVFFKWNPEKSVSDSVYLFTVGNKSPEKMRLQDALIAYAIFDEGKYDKSRTKIAYIYNDDVYLFFPATKKTQRITHTDNKKTSAGFSNHDKWITYKMDNDLFAWNIDDGSTRQLTHFVSTEAPSLQKQTEQEQWLINEQLRTSAIVNERKNKRDLLVRRRLLMTCRILRTILVVLSVATL